jgi:hypothetical protein
MRERSQERAQRRRRIHPTKQAGHPAMADHIQIVDAVRARNHACDDRGDLARWVSTRRHDRRIVDHHMLIHQARQPRRLGQTHHRDQARARHEILVIEPHCRAGPSMPQSHRKCLPSDAIRELQQPSSSQARRHFPLPTHHLWTEFIGGLRLRRRCNPRHLLRSSTGTRSSLPGATLGPAARRPSCTWGSATLGRPHAPANSARSLASLSLNSRRGQYLTPRSGRSSISPAPQAC